MRRSNSKVIRLLSNTRFRIFIAGVLFISIFFIILGINTIGSHAESKSESEVFFKSVRIECGDTLTSIAEDSDSLAYISIEDQVEQIKKLNHLVDDKITAGAYLIIPCYIAK